MSEFVPTLRSNRGQYKGLLLAVKEKTEGE